MISSSIAKTSCRSRRPRATTTASSSCATCRPAATSRGSTSRTFPANIGLYARTIFPGGNEPPMTIELALGQNVNIGRWAIPPPLAVIEVVRDDHLEGRYPGRRRVCQPVGHRPERGVSCARRRRGHVRTGRTICRRRTRGSRLSLPGPRRRHRPVPDDLRAADRSSRRPRSDHARDPTRPDAVSRPFLELRATISASTLET